MDRFQSPAYLQSQKSYLIYCMVQYFVSISVTEPFLSKLLMSLGFSDAQTGLISSLVSVTFLFGLSAIFAAGKVKHKRLYIIGSELISELLFSSLFLMPFLPVSEGARGPLITVIILAAYYFRYSVSAMNSRWNNSYVAPDQRGIFSANKELISLIGGMIYSLSLGWAVDALESQGKLQTAFLLICLLCVCFSFGSFYTLTRVSPENLSEIDSHPIPFSEVIKQTFGRREFRLLTVLNVLYCSSIYLTTGFLGTYKLNELGLSVSIIQLISLGATIARALFTRSMGRYSDKHSFSQGILLGLILLSAAFLVNVFTQPSCWVLVIVFTLIYNISMAALGSNFDNMLYSYLPIEYYVQASVIRGAISGLLGFVASLIGSLILTHIQNNGNTLWGIPVYGQQVLSFLSFLLTVITALFTKATIMKFRNLHQ